MSLAICCGNRWEMRNELNCVVRLRCRYLFLSDILCTGWHATELGQVGKGDIVAIWGAGPGAELRPFFCKTCRMLSTRAASLHMAPLVAPLQELDHGVGGGNRTRSTLAAWQARPWLGSKWSNAYC